MAVTVWSQPIPGPWLAQIAHNFALGPPICLRHSIAAANPGFRRVSLELYLRD